jgi:hypothetical protein
MHSQPQYMSCQTSRLVPAGEADLYPARTLSVPKARGDQLPGICIFVSNKDRRRC